MLIALLIVLGVNLVVVVAFAFVVLSRRAWLKRQPGEFAGAIRVSSGEIDGLSPDWKHGSGRWVRDVLVWSKAPLLLRNELVPIDHLAHEQHAHGGRVKRLGERPSVTEFASDGATIQVAARPDHQSLVTGPFNGAAGIRNH
jgi:hypothetical protein